MKKTFDQEQSLLHGDIFSEGLQFSVRLILT